MAARMALSADIAQRECGLESAAVLLAALPTLIVDLVGGRWFARGPDAGAAT